eukprot:scaffold21386_cov55-Phaeocystis_antarctica.AAC.2
MTLDVSKLSGWLNALAFCRVGRRILDAGRGAGREGRNRLKAGAQGTCGAHYEHEAQVLEAGRFEAERLVERRRGLPRFERRADRIRSEVRREDLGR